jgi:phenylalanyl-tRNA synthetase beta chain
VRDALAAAGLIEIVTFPGARAEDADALRWSAEDPRRRSVAIANPIQAGQAWLRTHLAPSLLRAAFHNLSHQVDEVALFEVGRTFHPRGEGRGPGDLPDERLQAVLLLTEERSGGLWRGPRVPVFFRAKGVAERLLGELGHAFTFRAGSDESFLHPGACGELHVGGERAVVLGEVHPESADRFGLEVPVALAVIDLEALLRHPPRPARHREVSRHPHVRRDLAFVVGRDVAAGELLGAIRRAAGSSLASADVFDRYEGPGVPEGRVSLAFRLVFQRADRTLTDAEVAAAVEKVVTTAAERFGAELR